MPYQISAIGPAEAEWREVLVARLEVEGAIEGWGSQDVGAEGAAGAGSPEARWRVGGAAMLLSAEGAGLALGIPFGAMEDEVDSALTAFLEAAHEGGAEAFDPQLGREVGPDSVGAILGQYLSASAWHLEYRGLSEDPRAGSLDSAAIAEAHRWVLSDTSKLVLILFALFVAAAIGLRECVVRPALEEAGFQIEAS